MGLVPNRKGQPLLVEWQVAHRQLDNSGQGTEPKFTLQPLETFAARAHLQAGKLPNRGQLGADSPVMQAMQKALPKAVTAMRSHMVAQQAAFSADLDERLSTTLAELERLQGRQVEQLTLELERQLETVKRGRFEHRKQQINRVFDDYRQWVHDTLTTEPQPWIQVLAAVTSTGA
jgi:chemotaxis protein histidine kinase CheA